MVKPFGSRRIYWLPRVTVTFSEMLIGGLRRHVRRVCHAAGGTIERVGDPTVGQRGQGVHR